MAVVVLVSAAGVFYDRASRQAMDSMMTEEQTEFSALASGGLIGRARPDFRLPDFDGSPRQAAEWDGQVVVVNFWASWCIPCRREMPALFDLQDRYGAKGVQVIGVALDEPAGVAEFLGDLGLKLNYPVLVGGEEAGIGLAKDYGNAVGILPYTVLVDRSGRIAFVQFGELTREQAEREIKRLL